jgi:predicted RNA binding protein YcfA (HicA-like mRNA interferase family)
VSGIEGIAYGAVERFIEANGFRGPRRSQRHGGSHRKFRHPDGRWTILSGSGNTTVPTGTLRAILRQTHLSADDLLRFIGRQHNPVIRAKDGFYAELPRRFSLRGGSVWWIGPFKTDNQALGIAGMVQGGAALVDGADDGFYVRVSAGLRLRGTPRIGPFRRPVEAGAVLGRLLPAGALPPETTPKGRPARTPPRIGRGTARAPLRKKPAAAPAAPTRQQLPENVKNAIEALTRMGSQRTEAKEAVLAAMERLPATADETAILRAVMGQARNPHLNGERVYASAFQTAQNPLRAACLDCGGALTVPPRASIVTCPHCEAKMAVGRSAS